MTEAAVKTLVFEALELLRTHRRDEAAERLGAALQVGPPTGEQWRSIALLAGRIGEIDSSLEASRRFAATRPVKLSKLLNYWKDLITFGRADVVEQGISEQPQTVQHHPAVRLVAGQLAAQRGDFKLATDLYLQVVEDEPFAAQAWFSLAMIHDMSDRAEWVDRMKSLAATIPVVETAATARIHYALGKSFRDLRDPKSEMEAYTRGAGARAGEATYQREKVEKAARSLVEDFTARGLASLRAPRSVERSSIFVNGLPRSGTTLVEQILTAHSAVADGAECNLARSALIPTGNYQLDGAVAYEESVSGGDDPWGAVNATYARMMRMRFRTDSVCVDKSLTQSNIMGLIAHALPDCPIIWMRRDHGDVALSCYRNFFTSPLPWCWRFEDMGHFFAVEDYLFAHWMEVLGDRILAVEYEALVRTPDEGMKAIAKHAGLSWEPGMASFHSQNRYVRTASLQQVRQPINASGVGRSADYSVWLAPFWRSYEATTERLASGQ